MAFYVCNRLIIKNAIVRHLKLEYDEDTVSMKVVHDIRFNL